METTSQNMEGRRGGDLPSTYTRKILPVLDQ